MSLDKIIIDAFENGSIPKNKVMCEPYLSKHNLYPTISTKNNYTSKLNTRLDLIAYSDGKRNLFQIAKLINKPLKELNKELKLLAKKKILSVKYL